MTISTTSSRQDYKGDGCTKSFAFTFEVIANTDLDVFVDGCQKLLTTDFSVTGVGAATGGTVVFTTAPGCNLTVAIVRDVPYTQATQYPENDPFPAASHEDALDKLTMLVQQIKEFATRSWRFAAGSERAASGYVVDEPVALRFPRVKADCTGIDFVTVLACGTYADPVTTKGDLIVGSDAGTPQRLGITSGQTLAADPNTGKPAWKPGVVVELRNKLDKSVAAGCVVALDRSCDRAVIAADSQGCQRVFVVAPAAVGDDCLGLFTLVGLVQNVQATGCINRGYYVRKSATLGAVECTGFELGIGLPPVGALGLALTEAAGNLVDLLYWGIPSAGHGLFGFAKVNTTGGALASFNVTSITDEAVGRFTVTWDRNFIDEHYIVQSTAQYDSTACAGTTLIAQLGDRDLTAGTATIHVRRVTDGACVDPNYTHVMATRSA